jgi:hypothetical protein
MKAKIVKFKEFKKKSYLTNEIRNSDLKNEGENSNT